MKFLGIIPTHRHLFGTDCGGHLYLLGTDINGRDVFSRLLFGGRISMTVGFLSLLIVFPIGLLYGGISGYFGGFLDTIMMRFAEAVMAIPSFYLLIILAAILPSGMTSVQRFALIIIILALIGWAGFARVVRGMVLSIKNEDFVLAEKTIAASNNFKTHITSDNKLCNNRNDIECSILYTCRVRLKLFRAWNTAAGCKLG